MQEIKGMSVGGYVDATSAWTEHLSLCSITKLLCSMYCK